MSSIDPNQAHAEPATACEPAPHDAALHSAIVSAAGAVPFNNRPGSLQRQCAIGLFVAALSDRLALAFPIAAEALNAVVLGPATDGNPAEHNDV
jgi:hypothetical protein